MEKEKGEHWFRYVEEMGVDEAYKWVKTDRDFVVDLPRIVGEDGEWQEQDEGKSKAIVRGLEQREEMEQGEEGGEWKMGEELSMEEIEEVMKKKKEKKAARENGLGGKILKMWWKEERGRGTLWRIYDRSLRLGYLYGRWGGGVGVVMRKPNKLDYSKPNSYRIINLLDVVEKGLERIVVGRWEK